MGARAEPPVRSIGTDPAAFTEFYRAHVDEVTRFVTRRVADPQLAADLTADVFLAVIEAAEHYPLALAVATAARSANAGVAAGLAGWAITVLSGQAADGRFTAAVSDSSLVPVYLAAAAICAAIVVYVTRIPRGTS